MKIADNRIIVTTSRFEVDINRPREQAVYRSPDDAWGLQVWNEKLPDETVASRNFKSAETFLKALQTADDVRVSL